MRPQGFPRRLRLRRRREFLRVQDGGTRHHMRHFLVFVAPTLVAGSPTRLGVTVTRKVGGAVVRNRIKRLVREAFRRERGGFRDGLDIVWIAKRGSTALGYSDVIDDMRALMRRPGLGVEQARQPEGSCQS